MLVNATNISKVKPVEIEELRAISVLTFTETFSRQNTEADMQKYILENLSTEKLTTELHTEGSSFYFLRSADQVIGYLKLNTDHAQTEYQQGPCVEIERIYLAGNYQGKGFGEVLLKEALQIASQQKAAYIWLGVWEQNLKAISFYKKHGFIQFDTHIFKLGSDEQTDILMKHILN